MESLLLFAADFDGFDGFGDALGDAGRLVVHGLRARARAEASAAREGQLPAPELWQQCCEASGGQARSPSRAPTKLRPAGDHPGHFLDQTGTSRGSPWALPGPNWDQQGITLGTSSTKLGPAGDHPGHFLDQTGTSRESPWGTVLRVGIQRVTSHVAKSRTI